jgi:hypothetical protein
LPGITLRYRREANQFQHGAYFFFTLRAWSVLEFEAQTYVFKNR